MTGTPACARRGDPRPRKAHFGRLLAILAMGLWTLHAAAAAEQSGAETLRKAPFVYLCSSSLFRTVNRNDALAALRAWIDMVGRGRGFDLDLHLEITDSLPEIRRRLEEGSVHLVLLDVVQYLELSGLGLLQPVFTGHKSKEGAALEYVLLVSRDSGISGIEDLRGRSIIFSAITDANLGRMWTEVTLDERRLGRAESFFSSIRFESKVSAAVLPVFFGKADAAVVDRGSYEVMREMNPQLGTRLRLLAASPTYVDGLLCLPNVKHEFRDRLLEALAGLHRDLEGQQILLVFKTTRLVPVDGVALENVRELRTRYLRLSRAPSQPSRTAGAPPLPASGGASGQRPKP